MSDGDENLWDIKGGREVLEGDGVCYMYCTMYSIIYMVMMAMVMLCYE